jgi:hypothetical protein
MKRIIKELVNMNNYLWAPAHFTPSNLKQIFQKIDVPCAWLTC